MTLTLDQLFAQAYEWQEKGHFHRAGKAYAEYLNHRREDPAAWNNLGNCYRSLGRNDKAIPCFDEALRLEPGRVSSLLNRGLAKLAVGDFSTAWSDYEARLETISFRSEIVAMRDRKWRGESLGDGQPLYLFSNQGLGDVFQTWRYLSDVAGRVKEIVLELQSPLVPLAGALPGNIRVVKRGEPVGHFSRWCELFSLPGIFGTTAENLPPNPPIRYERNAEVEKLIIEERLRFRDQCHIGLVWSGTPANPLNRFRACGLGHLQPLLALDSCRFYSLQKGAPAKEIETLAEEKRLVDLAPHLTDFAATATAIDDLDLIISTDTSVPNLVGMMGREAWVMLHRPADWRWGEEGDSTPWYPSLRLFRQKRMRDWAPLVEEVRQELLRESG